MAQIPCLMPVSRRHHLLAISAALFLGAFGPSSATTGHAEVNVAGTVSAVRIVANQDSVQKVLSVVTQTFNVRYRTWVPLSRRISGTYSGPLKDVILHLLDGYNYMIRRDGETTDITVFGRGRARAVPAKSQPAVSTQGFAARWR
jgi:hypothetical protein